MDLSKQTLMQLLRLAETADTLNMEIAFGDAHVNIVKGDTGPLPKLENTRRREFESSISHTALQTKPVENSSKPSQETDPQKITETENGYVLRASMAGTFYRSPSPSSPPFCEVGDEISSEDVIGLIEIMKLFNSIPAGMAGVIERFYVRNSEPVSEGQPILLISPKTKP
ncbi:biotin/lipoyl-containing protein [uncultured Sneathiella sp.]|uniref:acetyl-CoA carboxylase biotin carboxyl carrier protein n=1 Tax=uncultured Sneathiella sp. TaxID=879315 RepID=UPI0030DD4FF5|tara:strand:- start:1188 stop:1697 length:510 start_codon:yes stop_codon:yes gene_type:complete